MDQEKTKLIFMSSFPHDENFLMSQFSNTFLESYEVSFERNGACDAHIILNFPKLPKVVLNSQTELRFIMEPKQSGMFHGYTKLESSSKSRIYPSASDQSFCLPWTVECSLREALELEYPLKTRGISAIASTKTNLPGHARRHEFITMIENEFPQITVFGRGRKFELQNKFDGLLTYYSSIAIENTSQPGYRTEKLADSLIAWTVPIYYGDPVVRSLYPKGSFIWLPLDDFERARITLLDLIEKDDWETHKDALEEARNLLLRSDCFSQFLERQVSRELDQSRKKKSIRILIDFETVLYLLRDIAFKLMRKLNILR